MREMAGQQADTANTPSRSSQETSSLQDQHVLSRSKTWQREGQDDGDVDAKDLLDYATFSKIQARPGKKGAGRRWPKR